jgi:Spy/CpxP family protein refolding chaperone
MENSKIILVTLLVLTLLVGGLSGYVIAQRSQGAYGRDNFSRLMMLKNMSQPNDNDARGYKEGYRREHEAPMMGMHDRDGMAYMHKDRDRMMDRDQMHERKAEMFLGIMSKKCNLTQEQQAQVKDVLEASKDELKAAKDEFKDKLESVKARTDSEIEKVLTDEQKEQFEELKENARKCGLKQSMMKSQMIRTMAQKRQHMMKKRPSRAY